MPALFEQPLDKISDLADLLTYRADLHPDKTAYIFLKDGEDEECRVTYQELNRRARAIAVRLQSIGIAGERALLLYPPGLNYVAAFFGCLYAGVIAVPLYPPHPARPERMLSRILGVIQNAQPCISLTISSIFAAASPFFSKIPGGKNIRWLVTDDISADTDSNWRKPAINGDSIAFLQYTSGSTGDPKGVMVSHKNLLCNSALIHNAFQNPDNAHGVIWLPPYHDMGLIGGILQPLYRGFPATILSPVAFLQKPLRWLQAISRYRGTVSGGPNFAFDFCVQKISPEDRENLDLSSWEIAFNGSEPVRAETMARFADAFRDCGFRKEAFYPCYGLAEATLFVSGGAKTELPVIAAYNSTALEKHQAVACSRHEENAQTLVGCGRISPELKAVIVNPETRRCCAPDDIGEIWISGDSIAKGYWQNPEETRETFHAYLSGTGEGPFLRTGDMGFVQKGELFVTGRRKDLIIIRGRNHYPQDIELTVERSYSMMRPGCSAAFSVETDGEERLVVTAEIERCISQRRREPDKNYPEKDPRGTDRRQPEVDTGFSPNVRQPVNFDEAVEAVRRAVSEHHELQTYSVLLLKPGTIPKTSSGKIQRHLCKEGFLNKTLDVLGGGVSEKSGLSPDSLQASIDSSLASLRSAPPEGAALLIKSYLKYLAAKVLKTHPSRMDLTEPLTNLGIDSLRAVELQHSIEADLGIACSMIRFLEGPSIEQLAAEFMKARSEVRGQRSEEKSSHPLPLTSHLSHNQKSLWFVYQLAPESAAYNLFFGVRIRSELDIAELRGAFSDLMLRHSSLRTVYAMRGGEPVQEIREQAEAGWFTETDSSAWTEDIFNEYLNTEAHRPFDLEKGPVMRVHLFARSEKEHVLLLNIHHIATDLWSFSVILDDLGKLYEARRRGQVASNREHGAGDRGQERLLSLSYTDYVHWQAEMLAGSEGERLWNYWKKQLGGELPVLNLPADRPRPPVQTYKGAAHSFKIDKVLAQKIKSVGQASESTLYMTLLAAFQTLLYRYTDQEDIVVGSPAACRNLSRFKDLVGYLVNPLAMRADLSGNPTFRSFLGKVRRTVLDALSHQDYPFPMLVEKLQPERDPSRSPLFQVVFALQKPYRLEIPSPFILREAGGQTTLGSLEIESLAPKKQIAPFDLMMMVTEAEEEIAASIEYNTDLFDAATVERMAGHFQTLAAGIAENPDQTVGDLPILTEKERHQILVEFNDTAADYPLDKTVVDLFEEQVEKTPNNIAVVFEDRQLTYRELNKRSNRIAHFLRDEYDIQPDDRIGILLDRSEWMIIAILAVLKAGGAYVPVDPEYPKKRINYMLQDSDCKVLLTEDKYYNILSDETICPRIIRLRDIYHSKNSNSLLSRAVSCHLAYIIYTSGSTGEPKGVMIEHRSIANTLCWRSEFYLFGEKDCVLQIPSYTFDSSVEDIFTPLISGSKLMLISQDKKHDITHLKHIITTFHVTHFLMLMPPAFYRMLLAEAADALTCLRFVTVAGESIDEKLVSLHFDCLKNVRLYNEYGPTENSVCTTVYEFDRTARRVSLGKPIWNNRIYIFSRKMSLCPIGIAGEICISGTGLARGYLNKEQLTADKFSDNPLATGERIYRTGDIARWLPDGNIEFLGRNDEQVKIRGYRIEIGEIENCLADYSGVKEAKVVAGEFRLNNKELAVMEKLDANSLREHLRNKLPEYMIPSYFVQLEKIPLTPNGKVDRKALPVPVGAGMTSGTEYCAPSNEVEQKFVSIWQEILGVEKVGVRDNFFDLGGHSLLIAGIRHKVKETFNRDIPMANFFRYPTVAALAQYLTQKHDSQPAELQQVHSRAEKQKEALRRQKDLRR
jgi:amino acid adenylation domain-containing protein